MSDVTIAEMSSDNAVLLLAAAESLGLEPEAVRTTSDGFLVSEEVAAEAGLSGVDDDGEPVEAKSKSKSKSAK